MKIHGVKRDCSNPLFVHFRKHFCPTCNELLVPVKVAKVVNSEAEEAKHLDFSSSDGYMQGNIQFVRIELACKTCNKSYSIKEIKAIERNGNK